jgi:Arc/MetJ-type ribon-helix-helix transcriptional regulator
MVYTMDKRHKSKDVLLINFKLNKHVVDVLDQLVQTGLFKSRVDVVLAALRNYEFFTSKWEELEGLRNKKDVISE